MQNKLLRFFIQIQGKRTDYHIHPQGRNIMLVIRKNRVRDFHKPMKLSGCSRVR